MKFLIVTFCPNVYKAGINYGTDINIIFFFFSSYRNDGFDRFLRGEYEPYRKKDEPYPDRYRENWTGRREPEGWSTQNYIKMNQMRFSWSVLTYIL